MTSWASEALGFRRIVRMRSTVGGLMPGTARSTSRPALRTFTLPSGLWTVVSLASAAACPAGRPRSQRRSATERKVSFCER